MEIGGASRSLHECVEVILAAADGTSGISENKLGEQRYTIRPVFLAYRVEKLLHVRIDIRERALRVGR